MVDKNEILKELGNVKLKCLGLSNGKDVQVCVSIISNAEEKIKSNIGKENLISKIVNKVKIG